MAYRLRTKSDCRLYHVCSVFEPGTHAGPPWNVSLRQRASFMSSHAKIEDESLYRSTIVLTYDSALIETSIAHFTTAGNDLRYEAMILGFVKNRSCVMFEPAIQPR